jgi:hypothetical protein
MRKENMGASSVVRKRGGRPRPHQSAIAAAAVKMSSSCAMKIENGIDRVKAQSSRQATAGRSRPR